MSERALKAGPANSASSECAIADPVPEGVIPLDHQWNLSAELEGCGKVDLIELDSSYLDQVCWIERKSFGSPWSRELLRRTLEQRISYCPGFVSNNGLIAYAYNFVVVDELHLLNIAVHPDYRGKGVGRVLLGYLLLYALSRCVRTVLLEVRVTNQVAQSLYSSMGFRVVGVRRRYYRDNGEDALLLERSLSEQDLPIIRTFTPFR